MTLDEIRAEIEARAPKGEKGQPLWMCSCNKTDHRQYYNEMFVITDVSGSISNGVIAEHRFCSLTQRQAAEAALAWAKKRGE